MKTAHSSRNDSHTEAPGWSLPPALAPYDVTPRDGTAARILLVKTSSLGDVVHNLPVVADIKRHLPQAQIDWLVEESFAAIPALHPDVHAVIPVALRRWRKQWRQRQTWQELAAWRRRLRDQAYDLVIDTQGLIKSALMLSQTRLAPQGQRCGYAAAAAREPWASHFYSDTFLIPKNVHAVERNRWLVAAACDYTPDLPLDYGLSHLATASAHSSAAVRPAWLPAGDYAVLLSATSRDDKLWPEADWLQLIQALRTRGLHCLLPAGSAVERQRAERLASAAQPPSAPPAQVLVVPPQGIRELAQLAAGARLVVGVDTGLTHLAVALARPTIAIYCASSPALTGVYSGEPPISPAINLGQNGAPPSAATVIDQALALLG